jgi:hypothetical protein
MGSKVEHTTMNSRTQVTLDPEMQRRAQARAAELSISFAEYVRRLLVQDLTESKPERDISAIFDIADGSPTIIANDKKKMIAEAVLEEHAASRRSKKTTLNPKTSRR